MLTVCLYVQIQNWHQRRYALIIFFSLRIRVDFLVVNLDSLHFWQIKSSGMLDFRIFAHDKWIHVKHSEHSIMGLPEKGLLQKHVTSSQESSSETEQKYISMPDDKKICHLLSIHTFQAVSIDLAFSQMYNE